MARRHPPPEPCFSLFQALPTELRLAIWQFSCHQRVVEVWYDADADRCRTTARPPPILHVNRESRAEAMSLYRRAFVTRSCPDHFVYFSPVRDILYLPRHGLMGYDDTARDFTSHVHDTAPFVLSLAIDHVRTDTIRPWEPYNKLMLIFSFPNVQETILVVGAGNTTSTEDVATAASALTATGSATRALPSTTTAATAGAATADDELPGRRLSTDSTESRESLVSADSASSASDSDGFSSSSSPTPVPKIGDVELVDPKGDTATIMNLLDNVIESFSREICGSSQPGFKANDSRGGVRHGGDTADTDELGAMGENSDCLPGDVPHMPFLIPKAKTYHQIQIQSQSQKRRPQRRQRRWSFAIGCN